MCACRVTSCRREDFKVWQGKKVSTLLSYHLHRYARTLLMSSFATLVLATFLVVKAGREVVPNREIIVGNTRVLDMHETLPLEQYAVLN